MLNRILGETQQFPKLSIGSTIDKVLEIYNRVGLELSMRDLGIRTFSFKCICLVLAAVDQNVLTFIHCQTISSLPRNH